MDPERVGPGAPARGRRSRRAGTRRSSGSCSLADRSRPRTRLAERSVFIDASNHRRRHSSCEMMSPVAYEALLAERAAEADREADAA